MLRKLQVREARLLGCIALSASLAQTFAARAEDYKNPSIDNGGYSLFNPVPDDKLRGLLGITDVNFIRGSHSLAIVDSTLQD